MRVRRRGATVTGQRPTMLPIHVAQHPLVSLALRLHDATSALPMSAEWGPVAPALYAYLVDVYGAVGCPLVAQATGPQPHAYVARDDGRLWVAYSGGKDGLAAALKARALGYAPVLYHVRGVNRAYPGEYRWAVQGAAAAGMPLVVDQVRIAGKATDFLEAPTKNQVIAACMAARMVQQGGSAWGMGTHSEDEPGAGNVLVNYSDNVGPMQRWGEYLASVVRGLVFVPLLRGPCEALALVARAGLLAHVHGCLKAHRFQVFEAKRAAARWGARTMLPGRCGQCHKCWSETIMLVALGVVPDSAWHQHCRARVAAVTAEGGSAWLARPLGGGRILPWVGDPVPGWCDPVVLGEYAGTAWPDPWG